MNKKVIIIFSIILLTFIGLLVWRLQSNENSNTNNDDITLGEEKNENSDMTEQVSIAENKDIVLSQESELNYAINIGDSSVRNENSEYIIIGTIESVDGGINYNPAKEKYTNIQTIGTLRVDKVLKGNIQETTIPFIRLGGTISLPEYLNGLTDAQRAKVEELDNINKLSDTEKENKYVSYSVTGDITVENGKTYLMYLRYNEDYDRFGIVFIGQGLREVQVISSNSDEASLQSMDLEENQNILVKNNYTGEYESLADVIGDLNN